MITLNIETPNNPQNQSFLVFKRRRIIIRNNGIDSKMKSQTFTGIPKGKDAIIISLKYSMGQAYIASKEITTDDAHIKLDFRPVTFEELKTEIEKLN